MRVGVTSQVWDQQALSAPFTALTSWARPRLIWQVLLLLEAPERTVASGGNVFLRITLTKQLKLKTKLYDFLPIKAPAVLIRQPDISHPATLIVLRARDTQ